MEQSLESVLEECRQRIVGGESVEQCLAAFPSQAAALSELLPLVAPLRELAAPPDPAFAHLARQRFHARLREAQAQQPAHGVLTVARRWLRRIAIPLAAIVALGGSGLGLVTASADALPGSPLFPVQQAREQVVQRLARSPEQQATYQLGLAAHRLQLVHRAELEHASPIVVNELIAGMLQATSRAAQDLAAVPEPQRQRILSQAAPLLTREQTVLAAEQQRASYLPPAVAEQRRRQFVAAQQRLRAEQNLRSPTSQPAPTPNATAAHTTINSGALTGPRAGSVLPPVTAHRPAAAQLPSPTPRPAAVHRVPGTAAGRRARLRSYLGGLAGRAGQPVHTATP